MTAGELDDFDKSTRLLEDERIKSLASGDTVERKTRVDLAMENRFGKHCMVDARPRDGCKQRT